MAVASLTDTQGIVALAAAVVAVVALIGCLVSLIALRRLRADQRVVLGEDGQRDLVAHAANLQQAFQELREYVSDAAERWEQQLGAVELALQGAISHCALVRYDAYNELSGRQSVSIALLDSTRSGVLLSCIHHREQARVYAKQVHDGSSELELSPEEAEAMRLALSAPAGDVPKLSV
jgi:hypothetical protein